MREPEASDEIQRIGRQRCQNLARLTAQFILRRTSNVNKKYLPPKGMHLKIYYCSRFFSNFTM
jgi:DNA repair and recombination RAD54-like protein